MKDFVSVLKTFVISLIAIAIFIPAMICQASPALVKELKNISGNWYDTNGNLVLTISSDYKINGGTVLDVEINEGDYQIKIDEGISYRIINLGAFGSYEGYHEMRILGNLASGNKIVLRKTKEPRYFESVGGIYLGMDKNQVASLYGTPSSDNSQYGRTTWKYDNEGFSVEFDCGVVTGITIYSYGDRRFD